jgi:hypothetical protein
MIIPLVFSLFSFAQGATSYRGNSVLRCSPANVRQLNLLHDMDESGKYDFWKEPTRRGGAVDVMVSDEQKQEFMDKVAAENIPCSVMVADVQDLLDSQKKEIQSRSRSGASYFENYHPPEEVFAYYDSLAAEFPSLATTSTIGSTTDGESMRIIHISTNSSAGKKALWFDGGLHARCVLLANEI